MYVIIYIKIQYLSAIYIYIYINENQFHLKIRSLCHRSGLISHSRGNGHRIWCQEQSMFLWSAGPRAEGRGPLRSRGCVARVSWDRWVGIVEVGQICQPTQSVLGHGVLLVSTRECPLLSHFCQRRAFSLLILISHVYLSASLSCSSLLIYALVWQVYFSTSQSHLLHQDF